MNWSEPSVYNRKDFYGRVQMYNPVHYTEVVHGECEINEYFFTCYGKNEIKTYPLFRGVTDARHWRR